MAAERAHEPGRLSPRAGDGRRDGTMSLRGFLLAPAADPRTAADGARSGSGDGPAPALDGPAPALEERAGPPSSSAPPPSSSAGPPVLGLVCERADASLGAAAGLLLLARHRLPAAAVALHRAPGRPVPGSSAARSTEEATPPGPAARAWTLPAARRLAAAL